MTAQACAASKCHAGAHARAQARTNAAVAPMPQCPANIVACYAISLRTKPPQTLANPRRVTTTLPGPTLPRHTASNTAGLMQQPCSNLTGGHLKQPTAHAADLPSWVQQALDGPGIDAAHMQKHYARYGVQCTTAQAL